MLILSRVCAIFRDPSGATLFEIRPQDLLSFLDAPESIQEDPLFSLMLQDGSLEAVRSVELQKKLEADPIQDTTAEGRKPRKASAKATNATNADGSMDSVVGTADPAADPADAAPEAAKSHASGKARR